jgi:hypothetical protein
MEEKLITLFGDQLVKNVIDEITDECSGYDLEKVKRMIDRYVRKLFQEKRDDIIKTVKSEIKKDYINSLAPKRVESIFSDNIKQKEKIRRYIENAAYWNIYRTRGENANEIILEYLTNYIYTDLEYTYKHTGDFQSKFTFDEFVDIKLSEDYKNALGPMLECIKNDMQYKKHTSTYFQPLMNRLFNLSIPT